MGTQTHFKKLRGAKISKIRLKVNFGEGASFHGKLVNNGGASTANTP